MSQENQEHKIPDWLQKIQDNSSELELLISGGAIFGLIQLSNLLTQISGGLISGSEVNIAFAIIFAHTILSCITIGFVFHLMVRSYWLALVCLNYVYPNGINWEKLRFQKPYTNNKEKRNDLYQQIINADKLCGLIMFTCITASILIFGLAFIIIVLIALLFSLIQLDPDMAKSIAWDILGFIYIILGTYIIDLLSSGLLRKIPYLSYITYPFFQFLDLITLRFLARKGLWILASNTSIYRRTSIITVFIVISFIAALERMNPAKSIFFNINIEDDKVPNLLYRDEPIFNRTPKFSIDSKVISKNFIKLQIKYTQRLAKHLKNNPDISVYDIYSFQIDSIQIHDFDWSKFKRNKLTFGLEVIIPIDYLEKGKHILSIHDQSQLTPLIAGMEDSLINFTSEIPFWYDKLAANNK